MRVSGKITCSFHSFLKLKGFDVSRFFDLTPLEMEFLKNPSSWLDLFKVESFLKNLSQEYGAYFVDKNLITHVGQSCFELKAWGELDSVLKMSRASTPFSNLPVLLSYFISEGFRLTELKEDKGFFSFKSNLSSEKYPSITEYLRSVLESLPLYMGKPIASAKWIRDYAQIQWESNRQTSFFSDSSSSSFSSGDKNLKPELISDLRKFLEKVEQELYLQRKNSENQDAQIKKLKNQLLLSPSYSSKQVEWKIKDMEEAILELKNTWTTHRLTDFTQIEKEDKDNLSKQIEELLELLLELKSYIN